LGNNASRIEQDANTNGVKVYDLGRVEIVSLSDDEAIKDCSVGDDFGPYDLACVYRFCILIDRAMKVSTLLYFL
jgi:hypothetical protein